MKKTKVLFGAIALFSVSLFTSCQRCATCHNETTGDVQQICKGTGWLDYSKKEYNETIENFEELGYTCMDK